MKTILLPTDFSPASRPAIELGVSLARRTGARAIFFHLAYFSDTDTGFPKSYHEAYEDAVDKAKATLRKEIARMLKNGGKPFKHEVLVAFGPSASDEILDIVKEREISLVVMGTHGATGLKKLFFGSNTAHVVSRAKVPVLTVPYGKKIPELKKVYYSTDLVNAGREIDVVKRFCKKLGLREEILFVDYGWARSKEEERALAKLQKQTAPFTVLRTNLENSLRKVLTDFMRDKSGSILCLFHKRKSGIASFLFGTNSESLASAAGFPLLIFPK